MFFLPNASSTPLIHFCSSCSLWPFNYHAHCTVNVATTIRATGSRTFPRPFSQDCNRVFEHLLWLENNSCTTPSPVPQLRCADEKALPQSFSNPVYSSSCLYMCREIWRLGKLAVPLGGVLGLIEGLASMSDLPFSHRFPVTPPPQLQGVAGPLCENVM